MGKLLFLHQLFKNIYKIKLLIKNNYLMNYQK